MKHHTSRRSFLAMTGATALGFAGLRTYLSFPQTARGQSAPAPTKPGAGYGPLVPDPHKILDLPEGFSYRVISRQGERMDDGLRVPGNCDGSASFAGPDGKTIIIRNQELLPDDRSGGPFGRENKLLDLVKPCMLYDRGCGKHPALGGTTTLVYDTRTGKLERQFLSLAGTIRNCAGGPTPWGSWITCEETVLRAEKGRERDHGYNFEVPASAEIGLADPVPLVAMGRFNHEAVAVDPHSGIVYQTEDRDDGLIYRFIPHAPGKLRLGGRLQALVVSDAPSLDTRNWEKPTVQAGQPMEVTWIDLDEVESPLDDLRHRGFAAGAARFARGEGMWYGNDCIYFACTNGGVAKKGQIWKYVPSPHEGTRRAAEAPGRLELFIEPNDGRLVENADNLTVAPWGDLVLAEDGVGEAAAEQQFLVGVTPEGDIYPLARNAQNSTELTGVNFSPDETTLFVNLFSPGATLAVTGPWHQR
ncbi:MAG: alkaline phosphatase PhoX [Pirellulales bacterium]